MTIEITCPHSRHLPALQQLWQDVFGDDDTFLDKFFSIAFHPDRCLCALNAGTPVAAIYWMDATLRGKKVAYLYALATAEAYRGRGIARQLLDAAHDLLWQRGYQATLLVPGDQKLGLWYQRLGYEYCCGSANFTCRVSGTPVPLRRVTGAEYAALRKQYLPEGSVEQDAITLEFLASQAQLYAGETFLLAAWRNDCGILTAPEFLGDLSAIPGILGALEVPAAQFFSPTFPSEKHCSSFTPQEVGSDLVLPMFRPLQDPAMAPPAYFAFPFN